MLDLPTLQEIPRPRRPHQRNDRQGRLLSSLDDRLKYRLSPGDAGLIADAKVLEVLQAVAPLKIVSLMR